MAARDRLDRWQKIIGSADLLNKRLRNSDVSSRELDALLDGAQDDAALPPWGSTLASILNSHSSSPEFDELRDTTDRSYDPAQPLPFQEVLVGFVHYARERLRAEAGAATNVLSPSAMAELERQLLAHLTFVASLTLGQRFYEFRFEQAPASAMESAWCRQETSREIYWAYVRHMRKGGLIELFDIYPVLARLLSQSVEQWTRAAVSLCQRFLRDFSDLRTFFGWKVMGPEGAVAHLRTDLSDRHHGGQTVIECILQTEERVVYKPRTVRPEIAFYKFIDWLNDCGLSLDLRVVRALDRATHGWVESVVPVPCHSGIEVERFYTRAGMLLGVLHALATTDIHCENFIASGGHPVVVDLEMLLNDGARGSQQTPGEDEGEDRFGGEPSVLSTGLLPRWQVAPDGHQFDMSALGGDEAQDSGIRFLTWQSINTDQMILTEDTSPAASMTHRVRVGDKSPSVWDHMSVFLESFKEVYACLLANRQRLISDDRLLSEFDDLELRILIRSTETYTRLHLHLLHPEFLKDGIDRSIELEWLARPLSGTTSPQKGRVLVYEHERTAMENLDIPHFSTSAWRNMEHMSDDEDLFLLCGERDSQVLRRRLTILSPADCSRQLAIMEDAVRSRFERG